MVEKAREQSSFSKRHITDILALSLLAFIAVILYINFAHVELDDAYITYRIARNATNGLGLVYNQGEQIQVSSTPLYSLLLAFLGLFFSDTASNGPFISGIAMFGSSAFLFLWIRKLGGMITGLLAATLYLFFPLALITVGMETYLYLMFAIGAMYFYSEKRLTLTAIFLGLLLLTRADGIVLAAVIFAHFLWVNHRLPIAQIICFLGITAPWYVFSLFYYGSPAPATLAAKMAHGQSFWWSRHFLDGAEAFAMSYFDQDKMFILFVLFGAIGFIMASWKNVHVRLLFIWTALYSAGFTLLGVPDAHWYFAPLVPAVVVAAALGVSWISLTALPWLARWRLGKVVVPVSLLLSAVLLLVLIRYDIPLAKSLPLVKFESYQAAGVWLNNNTPPDSSVATVEIGIMGYFANRRLFDIIGLTHPDTAKRIANNDFTYAILHYQPDYVVLWQSVLDDIQTQSWFGQEYKPVEYLIDKRVGSDPLIIYAKYMGDQPLQKPKENMSFDNKIEINGISIQPESVLPGESLRLTLGLEELEPIQKDIRAFASVVDKNGRAVSQREMNLQPGSWTEGTLKQHFDIYVPATTTPGVYEVHAGMYYLSGLQMLQVIGQDGKQIGDRLQLGPVKIATSQDIGAPENPLQAAFGGNINLLGYNILTTKSEPKQLSLTLFWQAREQMQQDFTVFVHVLDSTGKLVSQSDGQPQEGNYPTSIWSQDEKVLDKHVIGLPSALPDGEYQIEVGMYYGPTGKRLEAESQGAKVTDNSVLIGKIRLP